MSDLGVFQVETSRGREISSWVAHAHHVPATGRVREKFPKCTSVQLVKDPDHCCANVVSVLWTSTRQSPVEGECYMVLFGIMVDLHVVRGHLCISPWDATEGVMQSSSVSMHAVERGCVHAPWVGGMEKGMTARFQKTECWDLPERTWSVAVSCEKAVRKRRP